MRLPFGIEIAASRECPDCLELRRELDAMRAKMEFFAENQMSLIDEIRRLRKQEKETR